MNSKVVILSQACPWDSVSLTLTGMWYFGSDEPVFNFFFCNKTLQSLCVLFVLVALNCVNLVVDIAEQIWVAKYFVMALNMNTLCYDSCYLLGKEVMFLAVSLCLSVSNITQKFMNVWEWHIDRWTKLLCVTELFPTNHTKSKHYFVLIDLQRTF